MQVWTASFLDCQDRFAVLQECIKSVHALNLPHFISVSTHNVEMIQHIKILFPNLTIYVHEQRLSQFEHIAHLLLQSNSDDHTNLIFLDDDDLLLNIPTEGFHAKQYSSHIWNYKNSIQYQSYCPYNEKDSVSYDFSGATCTQHQLRIFLDHMANYLSLPTLDLVFNAFINNPNDPGPPIVFRRKWDPYVYKKPWDSYQSSCSLGDVMKYATSKKLIRT